MGHWLLDGLEIEHRTTFDVQRFSRSPQDDPSVLLDHYAQVRMAQLLAPLLHDFAYPPSIVQNGYVSIHLNRPRLALRITLMVLSAVSAILLLVAVFRSGRSTLWYFMSKCVACGYDLSGITGPCPECGSERENKA